MDVTNEIKEEKKYSCCEECDARAEYQFQRSEKIEKLAWDLAKGRQLKAGESIPVEALLLSYTMNPFEKDIPEWIDKNKQIEKYKEEYKKSIQEMSDSIMKNLQKDVMEAIKNP